jgi:hypothetical protein
LNKKKKNIYKLLSISNFPFSINVIINSPNKVFAHANQLLEYFDGLFLLNDSCMNPVLSSVFNNILIHAKISSSFVLVNALIIMLIGQIRSYPVWGPPIPSAAVPLKK